MITDQIRSTVYLIDPRQKVGGSNPSGCANVMSRVMCDR